MSSRDPQVVLAVDDLRVVYDTEPATCAVNGVSLELRRGELLGVVGESGCGKSTLISALTRLQRPPARIVGGQVRYYPRDGESVDLLALSGRELRALRWERLAVVFQSAMTSLNPVMRLGAQFADVLRAHRRVTRKQAHERATELLEMVGIQADRLRSYPHELSGGQRQRVTIALALACSPDIVVMDEPTTAVDVVMQQQIMQRMTQLRHELGFAVVFVTHDLSLLVETADRIMVMYAGNVVETDDARTIYHEPRHPYTRGLRDSFPPLHGPRRVLRGVGGSPPDLRRLPAGCAFAARCPHREERCEHDRPMLIGEWGRQVACFAASAPMTPAAAGAHSGVGDVPQ